jgi:GPI ethanolamine phosphate transferase 1
MKNIQVVDSIVKKTESLLDNFYGYDGKTAFIFTADHGMSNIGNHGDGGEHISTNVRVGLVELPSDPDSTRTPLIAWGSGIRGPRPDTNPSSHDDYSSKWDLTRYLRVDVNQADMAPLMSYLIGANWAVNSVGVIPDILLSGDGYLDASEEVKARVGLVNAQVSLFRFVLMK